MKNRRMLQTSKIFACSELFQHLFPSISKSRCCKKTAHERIFESGREKLTQEIDIISFLKHYGFMRGAIKSLTTKEQRK